MITLLKKNIFQQNTRHLKKYFKIVEKINALEPEYEKLSDRKLRSKTDEFKEALQNGKTIDDIKIEAFATVREASKRVLGMRHFDVQLIGGLVLAEGNIAEMATGEGKTLVASLPSYLRALEGKGVHVITVNEYLAKRDRNLIGQIHEFLGLTVGLNLPMMSPEEKQKAYQADITYGVGTEFGFDYLRDHLVRSKTEKVQRPYHFALIDEVDSVLIDEAKTPLIIANKGKGNNWLRSIAAKLVKRFKENEDYTLDRVTKTVSLLDQGIDKVEKAFSIDNLYDMEHQSLYHYVIQAVRAEVLFKKDVDYIVKDGEIKLVDMFTGRIMEGRTLSDGLHQAIEAKENVPITEENKTQASITIQNYFRMYPILAGMTGTAKTEEKEFIDLYNMEVIQIPTNKPVIRNDMPDKVYRTIDEKYKAVTKEVKKRHEKGQPVLVGTTSILQSEKLAKYFDQAGIEYQLLNAKSVEMESQLIAQAGQMGRVTIATNMAGRGTDIKLGKGVAELGGLHVLGTERHESRRIDNQLKGRAGRQGDPGSSQFFISLEDDMYRRFAEEELEKWEKKIQVDEEGLILNKNIGDFIDHTQKIVEGTMFSIREYNLKLDNVINHQRNVIYSLRNKILDLEQFTDTLIDFVHTAVKTEIEQTVPDMEEEENKNWRKTLERRLTQILGTDVSIPVECETKEDVETIVQPLVEKYVDTIHEVEQIDDAQSILKQFILHTIDHTWTQHLEAMERLKEGIGFNYYRQEDPIRIYEREGLNIFKTSYQNMLVHICYQFHKVLPRLKKEKDEG